MCLFTCIVPYIGAGWGRVFCKVYCSIFFFFHLYTSLCHLREINHLRKLEELIILPTVINIKTKCQDFLNKFTALSHPCPHKYPGFNVIQKALPIVHPSLSTCSSVTALNLGYTKEYTLDTYQNQICWVTIFSICRAIGPWSDGIICPALRIQ